MAESTLCTCESYTSSYESKFHGNGMLYRVSQELRSLLCLTRNSHLWDRDNLHATVESNYQHCISINVWCGVIGDQLIGPYIFPHCLTGNIYVNILQDELPALLEKVSLQTRRQMYYQHDGSPSHFSQVVRQYLNHKFPN
jgi:hypothetical protein